MHPLARMILHRLALGLLTLFAISLFIFMAIELLPGDLAQEVLGQSATPETVAAFRRELGLDQPAYVRYLDWLGGIVRGDFGQSLANNRPISDLLAARLGNTLFLAVYAAVISVPLAVGLGLLAALYRGSWFDRGVNIFTLSSISFPEYFVAYILMLFLSIRWGIFPSISDFGSSAGLGEMLYRTFLPALTLVLVVTVPPPSDPAPRASQCACTNHQCGGPEPRLSDYRRGHRRGCLCLPRPWTADG